MAITPRPTSSETWLVGDIGATNARFGLVSPQGDRLHTRTLPVHDYPTISDAIIAYLDERGGLPMPRQRSLPMLSICRGILRLCGYRPATWRPIATWANDLLPKR